MDVLFTLARSEAQPANSMLDGAGSDTEISYSKLMLLTA
jgi:hypothetical protein